MLERKIYVLRLMFHPQNLAQNLKLKKKNICLYVSLHNQIHFVTMKSIVLKVHLNKQTAVRFICQTSVFQLYLAWISF